MTEQRRDSSIESRYLKKTRFSFFYNYFTVMVLAGSSLSLSFLLNPKPMNLVLGAVPLFVFGFAFFQRKRDLVTSVGIYKYSEIFMEILKSFAIKKKDIDNLKRVWKKKTVSK